MMEKPKEPVAEVPVVGDGDLLDPAVKMMEDEKFHRKLLEAQLLYSAEEDGAVAQAKQAEEEAAAAAAKAEADAKAAAEAAKQAAIEAEEKRIRELDQRMQPLQPNDEERLASKYAGISDVGERAFTILQDLRFFDRGE